MSGSWQPLPAPGPFPAPFQGTWADMTCGDPVMTIDGRRIVFCGKDVPVGELATCAEDGHVAVSNVGEDRPYELPWSQRTITLFWFGPDGDVLNFHGICDHGTAVRVPTPRDS